jgi:hypothetical protein
MKIPLTFVAAIGAASAAMAQQLPSSEAIDVNSARLSPKKKRRGVGFCDG